MLFSDQNLEAEKRSHLQLLMAMAKADGRMAPAEDRMIREVASRMGFSYDEVEALRTGAPRQDLSLPANEQERLTIFYHLLFLMRIDSEVTEEEMEVAKRLGFRLGLNPYMTDDLVRLMAKHAAEKIPAEAMAETVKKYLN